MSRRQRKTLLPILLTVSFITIAVCQAKAPLNPKQQELLSSTERAESYRLDPMQYSPRVIPRLMISKSQGFDIGSQGPNLNPLQIETVRSLFSRNRSYRNTVKTNCQFNPGVGLKFVKGDESLVLLFCFSCKEWAFLDQDQKMTYTEFGPDEAALIRLAKELFPQDEKIQALH